MASKFPEEPNLTPFKFYVQKVGCSELEVRKVNLELNPETDSTFKWLHQVSISSTFYEQLLCSQILKVEKRYRQLDWIFTLLWSWRVKAAHKHVGEIDTRSLKICWSHGAPIMTSRNGFWSNMSTMTGTELRLRQTLNWRPSFLNKWVPLQLGCVDKYSFIYGL